MPRINNTDKLMIIGTLLVTSSIILVVYFFLKGSITIAGNYPADVSSQSLKCTMKNPSYELYDTYGASLSDITVNMNFGNRVLESISLIYKLYFSSPELASRASVLLHSDMNESFGKNGYKADSFSAAYSPINNVLQMSLYHKGPIEASGQKYFILNYGLTDEESYLQNYTEKGFSCINN